MRYILQNLKVFKNRKFYASILIDLSFLAALFLFSLFMLRKIMSYALLLQGFSEELSSFESVIAENMSLLNNDLFLNNLTLINEAVNKMAVLFLLFFAGSFVIYCLFQGIQWSFILNNLRNFKKYIWRFSLVSLFSFILSLAFLYFILLGVRSIFINYFTSAPISGLLTKMIILAALLLILWHYTSICYVLISKYKLIETLRKCFLLRIKTIIIYSASLILILGILFLFPILNLYGLFFLVIELTLILFVINYLRYSFVKVIEK